MKTLKTVALTLCIIVTQLCVSQNQTGAYKDLVTDNPTTDADLKVMTDFTYALQDNNMAKVQELLDDNFKSTGPSVTDSQNKKDYLNYWTEAHKTRTNNKVSFVMTTFKVLDGDLKGHWVAQWGTYSFTQNGKDLVMPYQSTARIANSKIVETINYFDNLSLAINMGYKLTPASQN